MHSVGKTISGYYEQIHIGHGEKQSAESRMDIKRNGSGSCEFHSKIFFSTENLFKIGLFNGLFHLGKLCVKLINKYINTRTK